MVRNPGGYTTNEVTGYFWFQNRTTYTVIGQNLSPNGAVMSNPSNMRLIGSLRVSSRKHPNDGHWGYNSTCSSYYWYLTSPLRAICLNEIRTSFPILFVIFSPLNCLRWVTYHGVCFMLAEVNFYCTEYLRLNFQFVFFNVFLI